MSKALKRRNYPALTVQGSGGKWYTGWDGDAFTDSGVESYKKQYPRADLDRFFEGATSRSRVDATTDHETRKLRLQFKDTAKGRSSAVALFEDEEGFVYTMTLNTLGLILSLLHHPRGVIHQIHDISEARIQGKGTFIEGTFVQAKKGQNYFIEPASVL